MWNVQYTTHGWRQSFPSYPKGRQAQQHISPQDDNAKRYCIVNGTKGSDGGRKLGMYADAQGINPPTVRVTTNVVINALSAAGSSIEPRTEPMLYLRAK